MARPGEIRTVRAPTRDEVVAAAARVHAHLEPSPLLESGPLEGFLKVETVQPTGSFKVRGAVAALTALPPGSRVVTASAGNHGLGVAWAAARTGLDATVVVPETASPAKLGALAGLGSATVVRHGPGYDQAEAHALSLARAGATYVSPYNDTQVIAGQGSIGLELADALTGPATVVCPIGGGGLISGVALALSTRPDVRVVGVELVASAPVAAALAAWSPSTSDPRSPTGWPATSSRGR
jgi:threonine dehydratase